ncbi:MAG: translation initiation factor IF-2 [Planctomycetes bacterium]|nr:translation initiation factor IF-2 [Planctomycetota bacterium]
MRLHELAKEIGAESKLLLQLAKELNLKAKNHSATLAPGEIALLKAAYRETYGDAAPAPEVAPVAVEEPKDAKAAPRRRRARKSDEPGGDDGTGEGSALELESETGESMVGAETADAGAEPEYEEEATEEPQTQPDPEPELEPTVSNDARDDGGSASTEPAAPTVTHTHAAPTPAAPAATPTPPAPHAPHAAPHATQPEPKPVAAAASRSTEIAPTTGKVLQVPTPRRRPATGAKIVGRIELPQEEIQRSRNIAAQAPTPGGGAATQDDTEVKDDRFGKTSDRDEKRKQSVLKPKPDASLWTPEDEEDPLLQGIRVGHVQRGPHGRRPPRRVGPRKSGRKSPITAPTGAIEIIVPISVRDLSQALGVKVNQLINLFMRKGQMLGVSAALDETAVLEAATELGKEVSITSAKGKEEAFLEQQDAFHKEMAQQEPTTKKRLARPPVVAFLGHVDHGKTSLLDKIRATNVAAGEAGGITQCTRAYTAKAPSGQSITFLDTPGHRAFTEMRSRGANITDIVVLVVAADDGVMPQTEEAIQHAKAADTPIVVALNKCDKHEANPDRVLQQLAQKSVMVEEWGGETLAAKVSATTGAGIPELLEKILLQAEIMDITADPARPALATVLEAKKDEQLGAIATVLVREGTLRVGDILLAGTSFGRIRALMNDQGQSIQEAGPSTPVNVIGLGAAPDAGEKAYVVESLKKAREVAEEREAKERAARVAGPSPSATITLENLFQNLEAGKVEEIRVVLKADVKGSIEVLRRELELLKTSEVKVRVIRDALGGISEDDVLLAAASKAVVIGFNVVADDKARQLAEVRGTELRTYQVIYELIDDLKKAMEGALSPVSKETVLGHVEIKEVFKVSKLGNIAGCIVRDGIVRRNAQIRLTRDGRVIYTGKLESLKRFKEDVREVKEGLECGLRVEGYDDIKVGDVVEAFEISQEKRLLGPI